MHENVSKAHLLLVEDDKNLAYLLRENLVTKGFDVTLAETGEEGLIKLNTTSYNLCIFDVMLPQLDGFTLARNVKESHPNTPFIFLTARGVEKDKLHGFEIGADDYVTKPFNFKELYYRINVILRRINPYIPAAPSQKIMLGDMIFFPDQRRISIHDDEKKLSQREAGLLHVLLQHKGEYIAKGEILKTVWGRDDYFTGKSMDVYITRIRKVLKADPLIEIENLYGTGYRIKYNNP